MSRNGIERHDVYTPKPSIGEIYGVRRGLQNRPDHYKIKLRKSCYRLVYRVSDQTVTVTVVTVGRRDHGKVYEVARR